MRKVTNPTPVTDRYLVWITYRNQARENLAFYSPEPMALWSAFLHLCEENGHRLGPKNFIAARRFDKKSQIWVEYEDAQFHHARKQALAKSPLSVTEFNPADLAGLGDGELPFYCNRCGQSLADQTGRVVQPEKINLLWRIEEPVRSRCPDCGTNLGDVEPEAEPISAEETGRKTAKRGKGQKQIGQVSPLRVQFNAAGRLYSAVLGGYGGTGPQDLYQAAVQFHREALALLQRAELTADEVFVLRHRYGFTGRALTLEEIGQILGHTRERVREIEQKALRKMRHPSRNWRAFLRAGNITAGQELAEALDRIKDLEAALIRRAAAIEDLKEQLAVLVRRTAEFGLDEATIARATKMTIGELNLSRRASNALHRRGRTRVVEILGLDMETLLGPEFPNFGRLCLTELNIALAQHGFPPVIGTESGTVNAARTRPPFGDQPEGVAETVKPKAVMKVSADTKIEALGLSIRSFNCLKRDGILYLRQLFELTEDDIFAIRNFGAKSLVELNAVLEAKGWARIRKM